MIHVHVLYPYADGVAFDHTYYAEKHFGLVQKLLAPMGLRGCFVERGLGSAEPGSNPPYVATGTLVFDSVEAFGAAFAAHGAELMADIPNYTDAKPVIQIGQVTLNR